MSAAILDLREALRQKTLDALAQETEARDTFEDGYANGLLAALRMVDKVAHGEPIEVAA